MVIKRSEVKSDNLIAQKTGNLLFQDKQRWVDRFCMIKAKSLFIFKSESDKKTRTRVPFSGVIKVNADPALGKPFAFELERKKDNVVLAASSHAELLEWIDEITKQITKH